MVSCLCCAGCLLGPPVLGRRPFLGSVARSYTRFRSLPTVWTCVGQPYLGGTPWWVLVWSVLAMPPWCALWTELWIAWPC